MKPYGLSCGDTCTISVRIVCTIEQLYDKAISAVEMNSSMREWVRTTVRVSRGCLLSYIAFNIFLKRIMYNALKEHDGKVCIGGFNVTCTGLGLADDIDALAEEEQELEVMLKVSTKPVQGIRWRSVLRRQY